ncbi:phytanoyl-CoA dioxygenase family protein [Candidatus Poriferisocius sp.]|uniref:phytanoyl-CoA dioxygenase family protein n=1 Tax=Candidatus Poriferisocius sp. TaxID=3101276 RepID=UPI003B025C2C
MSIALVTDQQIKTFWRDGVVVIRGVLSHEVLDSMAEPVKRVLGHQNMTNMTELGSAVVPSSGGTMLNDPAAAKAGAARGQFRSGTDHWWDDPDFERFATRSPLPQLAAELLRSRELWFYEDSVLVKEPHTQEPTAIHQDMAYFQLEGNKVCTIWCPLDPISRKTGATVYVRGSHLWQRDFRPNWFVSQLPMPGTRGEEVPPYDRDDPENLLSFDMAPGDVAMHHAMTLHGAHANITDQWRRAISVRYCGDGTVYRFKPGTPLKPHHTEITEGDPVDHPRCPRVWPR